MRTPARLAITIALIAASISLTSCSAPPAPEPVDTETETVETTPVRSAEETSAELRANIDKRPLASSPEYDALVDSFSLQTAVYPTQQEVLEAFARTPFRLWERIFDEIPVDYYASDLGSSLDEMADRVDLPYWTMVYARAIFGRNVDLYNLGVTQIPLYDRIVSDTRIAVMQYILTADEEFPTNYAQITANPFVDDFDEYVLQGHVGLSLWPNHRNDVATAGVCITPAVCEENYNDENIVVTLPVLLLLSGDRWIYALRAA